MAYLSSDNVNVFPAGFRGAGYITGKTLSEEALISLRTLSNYSINRDFFIMDPDDTTNTYCLIGIAGYVFKVKKSDIDNTNYVYAYIRLRESTNDRVGYILDNITRSESTTTSLSYILDVNISTTQTANYEFQGLCLTDVAPSTDASSDGTVIKSIKIREGSGLNFTAIRMNSTEIRDENVVGGEASTKPISLEFHTGTLVASTSLNVPSITTTTINDKIFNNLFVAGEDTVKVQASVISDKSIKIDSAEVGVLYQNESLTSVLKGTSTDGKKFVTMTNGAAPLLASIAVNDVPELPQSKITNLETDLGLKLNAANGVATGTLSAQNITASGNINVSGSTTLSGATEINNTLNLATTGSGETLTKAKIVLTSDAVIGTTLPTSAEIGLIFFKVVG